MFEALIYDERDKDSADPASTLGTYDSVILAEKAKSRTLSKRK
jgi:hypothetical protein